MNYKKLIRGLLALSLYLLFIGALIGFKDPEHVIAALALLHLIFLYGYAAGKMDAYGKHAREMRELIDKVGQGK